ncbi:S-adenosyl-L-methionine-dependent methyltransferase [Xylariales sp. PMI_506]|nr:S-adenosyl-L-methionine-dependent methyltransferase [Xylariales sp. PMI_506]
MGPNEQEQHEQNETNPPIIQTQPSTATRAGYGLWHVPIPILPSQLVESYTRIPPPSHIFSESAAAFYDQTAPLNHESSAATHGIIATDLIQRREPSFAETANGLINQILDRTPTGESVIDPDSIIGESLRLYHGYKDGKYLLPNDAAEQDRLDLQHEIFRIIYDGWLSLTPLSKAPEYVLDIGTGTGIWAFEFGKEYEMKWLIYHKYTFPLVETLICCRVAEQNPSSYVIGADLSSIQPTNRNVPNCIFVKTDIEDDWVFQQPNPDHQMCRETGSCEHKISFDYIHMRLMCTCFNDPRTVMRTIFNNLSTGGWVEFQEATFDIFQVNPNFQGDAFIRWAVKCTEGAATMGRDLLCVKKYKQWLEEIGFVDVTERKFLVTSGEWAEDPKLRLVGRYVRQDVVEGIRSIGYKMLRLAGMTTDQIELLTNQCLIEIQDPENRPCWYNYVIYARKP